MTNQISNKDRLIKLGDYLTNTLNFIFLKEGFDENHTVFWNISESQDSESPLLELVVVLNRRKLEEADVSNMQLALEKYFLSMQDSDPSKSLNKSHYQVVSISGEEQTLPSRWRFSGNIHIEIASIIRGASPRSNTILRQSTYLMHKEFELEALKSTKEALQEDLSRYACPIILCEGKTDKMIIDLAWSKLYSGKAMPFMVLPAGRYLNAMEDKFSAGSGAKVVQDTIELASILPMGKKKMIGLFDNDAEGNGRYKGLNPNLFEAYTIPKMIRKHKTKEIYGMLLPCPDFRSQFVYPNNFDYRFFVVEHYFSDEVLKASNMKGQSVAPDSEIFHVNNGKARFTEKIKELSKEDFEGFRVLFDELLEIIN